MNFTEWKIILRRNKHVWIKKQFSKIRLKKNKVKKRFHVKKNDLHFSLFSTDHSDTKIDGNHHYELLLLYKMTCNPFLCNTLLDRLSLTIYFTLYVTLSFSHMDAQNVFCRYLHWLEKLSYHDEKNPPILIKQSVIYKYFILLLIGVTKGFLFYLIMKYPLAVPHIFNSFYNVISSYI